MRDLTIKVSQISVTIVIKLLDQILKTVSTFATRFHGINQKPLKQWSRKRNDLERVREVIFAQHLTWSKETHIIETPDHHT